MKQILSLIKMLSLPQAECEVYCREKRLERYRKYGGRVRFLRLHRIAHDLLVPILKVSMRHAGWKLKIIRDDRKQTRRPVIFCPTHIGGLDAEMAILAVKTHCWVIIGDPRELYKDPAGMMLQMNGWIPIDVAISEDRKAAKAQMKAVLESGEDLLLFPEGTYNVSENLLLNHLFAGALDLAITCGAEIVPMAMERHDGTYYCIIGENLDYTGEAYEDRFRLSAVLRDHLATLKWELIEQLPQQKRADITEESHRRFLREVVSTNFDTYSYSLQDMLATRFIPKGIVAPEEAFSFLGKLRLRKANAFLAKSVLRYLNP